MSQLLINIGASANDGTGDTLRDAFDKTNDNFTDLYSITSGLSASTISNTPSGNIAAITVQAAINELDSEKSPLAGSSSLTTLGTIGTGTWQGSLIGSTYGGTGVNNAGRTLTISTGNITLTAQSGGSSVTLPASGTLVNTAVTTLSSLSTIGTLASNLVFTDSTYDIGGSGFGRPRDLFLSRNATIGGTVSSSSTISDSKGNVRSIPQNNPSSNNASYTLVAADTGKHVYITGTALGVTIPAGVFSVGDNIMVVNNLTTPGNISIVTSAVTCYLAGTSTSTSPRTLAQKGVATILCVAANTFFISGAGLT